MSDKPRIGSLEWHASAPRRGMIFNRNYHLDGGPSRLKLSSPWAAVTPSGERCNFGSHEAAVRHLVKKGWRKL